MKWKLKKKKSRKEILRLLRGQSLLLDWLSLVLFEIDLATIFFLLNFRGYIRKLNMLHKHHWGVIRCLLHFLLLSYPFLWICKAVVVLILTTVYCWPILATLHHSLVNQVVNLLDLMRLLIDLKALEHGLFLDLSPLRGWEQSGHGQVHAPHVLQPTHNLQLLLDELVSSVRDAISRRVAPSATIEQALETKLDTSTKANGNASKNCLFTFCITFVDANARENLIILLHLIIIVILNQISVIADVIYSGFVLKNYDWKGEQSM